MPLVFLLSILWFIRTAKAMLFWVYLWQLKEYHVGRLKEHFKTHKGKQIFFHPFLGAKIILLVLYPFFEVVFWLILLLYVVEALLFGKAVLEKSLLLPVITTKTLGLSLISAGASALFLYGALSLLPVLLAVPALIVFDLALPLVVAAIVLSLQPLTFFWRSRIIAKAKEKRKSLNNLKVVAITGSYGKTTTKEILFHILQTKFVAVKTPEHRNSEIGIATTVLYDLTDEHQVFVCEMGAYNKGGIKLLAGMVQPDLGIVTGVNEQHLGVFGNGMNLFSAEGGGELVEALPQEGALILNDDSRQLHELGPWLQLWNPEFPNYIWCSASHERDVFAQDIVIEKERVQFRGALANGDTAEFSVSLGGKQSVENILLAVAAASQLGVTVQESAKALEDLPTQVNPMRLKKGKGGFDLIDASYSANPTGVKAAIEYLELWKGKKIVVMPSLIELGKASEKVHIGLGRKIGETCDYLLVTSRDQFEALEKGALERGMKKEHIVFLENAREIASAVEKWAGKGDVVLLEGRVPKAVLEMLEEK